MSQQEENFRFDNEFVKMIATQAEHKMMLNNLNEKIEGIKSFNSDNFEKLSEKLEEVGNSVSGIKNNCIAHKVIEDEKKNEKNYSFTVTPTMIKLLGILIASIAALLFGIDIKTLLS